MHKSTSPTTNTTNLRKQSKLVLETDLSLIIYKGKTMRITFTKENLLHVVNALQKVSQNKTSSNLPGAIYITTKGNQVEFQANDFELGMKVSIDANIEEQGTAVVSSYNFNTFIQKAPGTNITINKPEDSNKVTLQADDAEFVFLTINPEDFALVEQIHNENQIDLDSDQLKELIDLTTYAAATEDDRPVFQGALLEINESQVTMVATDTHRMAVKKVAIDTPASAPVRCIIPTKTLAEVSRLLPKNNPSIVNIVWNRTQIVFTFENIYIISRLIEGTYPEYEKVIPAQFDSSAIISRKEFADAVDLVSFAAKDFSYNVIRYDWSEKSVVLSSQNSESNLKREISVEFTGTPFTINFNGRYITDILRHSTGETVHLYLKQNGPVVIRQDNNPNYTYVVTPVRV